MIKHLKTRVLNAILQFAYRTSAKLDTPPLREHRMQCALDILNAPENGDKKHEPRDILAERLLELAATEGGADFFGTLSSLAAQQGLYLSRIHPDSTAAPADVAHMMENVLRPHHRSVYWGDRLCTLDKAMAFLDAPRFAALFAELNGRHQYDQYNGPQGIAWRFAVLAWAARRALHIPGDFVECGVFQGDMSYFLVSLLNFSQTGKQFYLYDSFDGFDFSQTSQDDYPMNDGFLNFAHTVYQEKSVYENVVERFAPWENVRVIKGYLPGTLDGHAPDSIAYLHIDLNAPKPEIGVLERLFPRMSPGGVIVFDDYGWREFIRQREAEDAFMRERGYEILELPTGQGLVVL